jgi:mRNA interferase HicA
MKREKLVKRIRRWARDSELSFEIDEIAGKGSHIRIFVGGKSTIVKHGELSPSYTDLVLRQLGIPKDAIKR